MKISKEFRFEAAHRLPPDDETYGVCCRLHGHSYRVVVEVEGKVNEKGWIMNFKDIGKEVDDIILSKCDHMFLHFNGKVLEPSADYIPYAPEDLPTTAENLALFWGVELHKRIMEKYHCHVSRLEVWETAKCPAIVETLEIEKYSLSLQTGL